MPRLTIQISDTTEARLRRLAEFRQATLDQLLTDELDRIAREDEASLEHVPKSVLSMDQFHCDTDPDPDDSEGFNDWLRAERQEHQARVTHIYSSRVELDNWAP